MNNSKLAESSFGFGIICFRSHVSYLHTRLHVIDLARRTLGVEKQMASGNINYSEKILHTKSVILEIFLFDSTNFYYCGCSRRSRRPSPLTADELFFRRKSGHF